jgi:hypothetical protein
MSCERIGLKSCACRGVLCEYVRISGKHFHSLLVTFASRLILGLVLYDNIIDQYLGYYLFVAGSETCSSHGF